MNPINIPRKICDYDDNQLKTYIKSESFDKYKQESKTLQVDTVANLVRGRNTFLLAATGYGKSRIPEMYLNLTARDRKGQFLGVVVVLNPLDALGDNQVEEKISAGYTAINLTQLNFNQQTANEIKNGLYNFVYLSPEIFLNNKGFEEMYLTPSFQQKLVLVVVDEAHMIYSWGLVESGKRHLKTLVRHQDQCAFRPSYGNIGAALLNKNNAPILLMSATCRPKAIEAIRKNLKLVDTDLDIIKGELSRPEIRILRITMNNSLNSCLDLLRMYPSQQQTPNSQLVPTLIYSGTRHATLKVLEVLDAARETPGQHLIAGSDFARRYHACTGELDKQDCISDFAEGKVPLISCTLALGMGQNWRSVRQVVHIGRGDPSLICQMIGRAGRDGEPALAVLFVEKTRKNGKNSVSDFTGPIDSDEDRMDALAVTPVCLRVAFKVDNS
ncbi:uncharacterized protein PGTG_04525 [Puccinia graminis f. sp. tritici CRL 75-36-700-3]|uniref:DNA 3'-5' helicase n=1 Tax=Puccinia graminis f. sp. tritici (strain CRL 75-36-700-3 / race SCCL) TaxID=418459 RepID=E3K2K0_PUCGT|nr:uncharacterized protein PGTG_04525 [Puccinia graminis f. sp. tritici CRL 75-36-700-3]EFP78569.2 hypothetical protein PGTG_04525 [Puccinia graminis f. sp. tritici CRL 75-36-700-3]